MNIKILIFLTCIAASSQTYLIFGKDGLIHKAAEKIGISNLINVEGDATAKIGKNEVAVDGAFGIGERGVGAHGAAKADVLGQKARISADVLDGQKIVQHNHEVYLDNQNRQYILEREYVGSNYVLVRKYFDDRQVYLGGPTNANVVQRQEDSQYGQYALQESYVPQRQNGYVQPERYGSENYQPRNYGNRPGVYGQQYQQSGLHDRQSGQYDQQYENYDQQYGRNNQQNYGPQSTYQQPGQYGQRSYSPQPEQGQQNHEVYLDNQNHQYILQQEYVDNKLVQVRKYLDNGQKYVVGGGNVDNEDRSSHINHVVEAVDKNVENYRHDFESGVRSVVNKVQDVTGYKPNLGQGSYAHQPASDGNIPDSTTDVDSKIHHVVETINKNVENYRHDLESGVQNVGNKIDDVTGYKQNLGHGSYAHQLASDGNIPDSTTDVGSKIHHVVETIDKNVENYRHDLESGVHSVVNKIGDVTGYKSNSRDQQRETQHRGNYSPQSGNLPTNDGRQFEVNEQQAGNYGQQTYNSQYHRNHKQQISKEDNDLPLQYDNDLPRQMASTTSKIPVENLQAGHNEDIPLTHDLSKAKPQINGQNSVNDNGVQTTENIEEKSGYYSYKTLGTTDRGESIQKVSENDIQNLNNLAFYGKGDSQTQSEGDKQDVENETELPE